MKKEKITKDNREERSIKMNDDAGSLISRRQFSLGISGIVLAGAIVELPEHNAPTTKNATLLTQPGSQKLAPHASSQPQYILADTTGSVWSPDSQHIATFHENSVMLYNADTGKIELTYNKHIDEILTVKWSADSKYLASSGFDHNVHVWEAVLGQTMTIYKGHSDIVRDLAWSPDQYYLASAGYDKTVQVWEALSGRSVVTYSGHAAEIQALTWSPDSRRIASTDLQNRTMIWRVM